MDLQTFDNNFEVFRKTSAITKKHICWTCFIRFVEKHRYVINLFPSKSGNRFLKYCLDILMIHDCIDKTFLYTLVEFYFRWHFHDCMCEDKGPEMQYMYNTMKPLELLRSSLENKPFSQVNFETLPMCINNVRFMLILSKYGIDTGSSVFNLINAKKSLSKFLRCVSEIEMGVFPNIASEILELFVRRNGKMPISQNQRGVNYIYLLVRILHAINLDFQKRSFTSNFIKCLKVFYRTVPDPFVSQGDVEEFLCFLWTLMPFQLTSLTRINNIYRRLFKKESPSNYGPRSLKHLCRISVRNSLRNNLKMLPHSVKRLHIPRDLHDYLLCVEPLHM